MTTDTIEMSPAIIEALSIGNLPEVEWQHNDDLCDCTFQRVGLWKNPYFAETLEVRLCCVWAKFAEQYPGMVRTSPGYFDDNKQEWVTQPWEWNGEAEMPKSIWYRHLARKLNRPLSDIRAEYANKDELRPKGRKRGDIPFVLVQGGVEFWINFGGSVDG